tara:strand:+ start:154 stop:945 length:792 start_codon:yes stop_codon:yes gene_type:complete
VPIETRSISSDRSSFDPEDNVQGITNNVSSENNIVSSSSEVRPDEVTTEQRDLLNPKKGESVFNKDSNTKEYWNGISWVSLFHNGENEQTQHIDISNQFLDLTSDFDGKTLNMTSEESFNINLPSINSLPIGFSFSISRFNSQDGFGDVNAFHGDDIRGKDSHRIFGNGFLSLSRGSSSWIIDSKTSFDTSFMEGKTKELFFENKDEVTINHNMGFIPIVQVWVKDDFGLYMESNVDITHDWETKDSFTVFLSETKDFRIIYN